MKLGGLDVRGAGRENVRFGNARICVKTVHCIILLLVLREYKLVGMVWLCLGIMLGRVCRRNGVSSFRMG
jgi:hypothetical protein